MQTVLYVSPMKLGHEVQVSALASGVGAERHVAFIGTCFDGLEIKVADGDFQEHFHHFLATPEVARFFTELTAHVAHRPGTAEGTADMPLATALLRWRSGNDALAD